MTEGVSRRKFLGTVASAGVGGLAMAGILTACGKSASGGGDTGGGGTEAAPTTSAGQDAANNGKPIVIGSPYPLSGPAAADGEQMKGGSDLAIKEINDTGGIAGRTIEHTIVDTDIFTPEGVTAAFNQLLNDEVDALCIGYVISQQPTYELTAPYGCPYLNASTSEAQVDLTRADPEKYAYIFQIDPSEKWYGTGFPPFLDNLIASGSFAPPAKTIHILEGDSPYSQTISKNAQEKAAELGWEIVGVEPVQTGTQDWSPQLAKVKETNPTVVMDTHWVPSELAALMKQWAASPPSESFLYLQYGASVPEFLEIAGEAANGVVWATVTGVYNDVVGKRFQDAYQALNGSSAGFSNSGSGYDEVYMLARAWGKTGDPRDFKANVAEIKKMIHRGVNGGYEFQWDPGNVGNIFPDNIQDHSLGQAHLFFQILADDSGTLQHQIIQPAPVIQAEYVRQPWLSF